MSRKKVSIIGAGNVGATATYYIAEKVIADIVMVDVVEGMTQAKALDFLHVLGVLEQLHADRLRADA